MSALLTFFKHNRNGLAAILFLLVALFLMLSVKAQHGGLGYVRGVVVEVVGTIQRVVLAPVDALRHGQQRLAELARLDEDNLRLRRELETLRPLNVRLEELTQENRRLRTLLKMAPDPARRTITARVVGNSSSAFARALLVDVGSDHGLAVDAPVAGIGGLVGRVVEAGRRHGQVLTLLDLNSRVPVVVQRSRVRAMAAGDNSRLLQLDYVPQGADVMLGDLLVTSGAGGLYPKGLLVGRVVAKKGGGTSLFQKVTVLPAVDFDRVEEVRLLTPVPAAPHVPRAADPLVEPGDPGAGDPGAGDPGAGAPAAAENDANAAPAAAGTGR